MSSESSGEISDDDKGSFIGPDVGLQFMKQRDEWEKQEETNKERPNLHYQDILFDGELSSLIKRNSLFVSRESFTIFVVLRLNYTSNAYDSDLVLAHRPPLVH